MQGGSHEQQGTNNQQSSEAAMSKIKHFMLHYIEKAKEEQSPPNSHEVIEEESPTINVVSVPEKKRRGRPPKINKLQPQMEFETKSVKSAKSKGFSVQKRSSSRKTIVNKQQSEVFLEQESLPVKKRGRGRPPKKLKDSADKKSSRDLIINLDDKPQEKRVNAWKEKFGLKTRQQRRLRDSLEKDLDKKRRTRQDRSKESSSNFEVSALTQKKNLKRKGRPAKKEKENNKIFSILEIKKKDGILWYLLQRQDSIQWIKKQEMIKEHHCELIDYFQKLIFDQSNRGKSGCFTLFVRQE